MTRYVPIKSIKPIIAGRPNALSKMSLLEFILLKVLYVKKYNSNINICKGIRLTYTQIKIYKLICLIYVAIMYIFCAVTLNLFVGLDTFDD